MLKGIRPSRSAPIPLLRVAVRRFFGFVLIPSILTVALVVYVAQGARDERRDAYLSRIGGLLATAVQEDLAATWGLLASEAEAVERNPEDPTSVGPYSARDTVRTLVPAAAAPEASLLFVRGDSLVSATSTFRSPLLAEVPDVSAFDAAIYLDGSRILPNFDGVTSLPPALPSALGWNEAEGAWVTAASAESELDLTVAIRPSGRRRSVISTRTTVATFVVLILALLSAWMGMTGRTIQSATGPVTLALALMVGGTAIVAGGVAVAEARLAEADRTRELSTIASLARARGLLSDPVAAQRWLGSDVIYITNEEVRTGDGAPPSIDVGALPTPAPAFPASGATSAAQWLVVAPEDGGRTVFVTAPPTLPPLFTLAGIGTLLVLLGAIAMTRAGSVEQLVRTRG